MSSWDLWWWVILPYLALATFVIGHIWRWRYDQFGWTSRSTQLQERRLLKWGGPLFHYGTFAAIAGHVLGILVPESFTRWLGIPEDVLEQRLRGRSKDTEAEMQRRLATARSEASTYVDYNYVIVNDDLEPTVVRLQEIIAAERSRTHRMTKMAEGIIRTFRR